MSIDYEPFDVADYIDDPNDLELFLNECLEQRGISGFIHGLNTACRSKGMSEIARQSGINRESLYKSLSGSRKPKMETIASVLDNLGFQFSIRKKAG